MVLWHGQRTHVRQMHVSIQLSRRERPKNNTVDHLVKLVGKNKDVLKLRTPRWDSNFPVSEAEDPATITFLPQFFEIVFHSYAHALSNGFNTR